MLVGIPVMMKFRREHTKWMKEKERYKEAAKHIEYYVAQFRATAISLLERLQIPINLDDIEEILRQLEQYDKWGLELERFYTTT